MVKLPENIEYIDIVWPRRAFIIRAICENYHGGRVIDIGCGKGRITKMLGKLGVDILGVDIDEREIKEAIASNECENVHFACVNVSDVAEKFSGVILIEVLEHIERPLAFLKEISRICENDGFLVLTVPNGYCVKEMITAVVHRSAKHSMTLAKFVKWYRKIIKRDRVLNESQHVQWFTLKKIRALIEQAGFSIQEESHHSIWSGLLWVCLPWIKAPFFVKKLERRLATYLPYYFLEGWKFLCLKNSQD